MRCPVPPLPTWERGLGGEGSSGSRSVLLPHLRDLFADVHLQAAEVEPAEDLVAVLVGRNAFDIRPPDLEDDVMGQEHCPDVLDEKALGLLVLRDTRLLFDLLAGLR